MNRERSGTGLVVDGHTHVTPLALPQCADPALAERWPCMRCAAENRATLLTGSKPFRELDDRSWDGERRKDDMARSGIDRQVLSPMPELLSYWFEAGPAESICDAVNHQIADLVARDRTHFRGLGAVTAQEPERAAAQLRRLRSEFGLSGVEIGSNIGGMMLGDPRLEPFYAAAEEEGLAVFVHALHPLARQADMSPDYVSLTLFPVDVAMAASSLLLSGVMERFPRLRIGFSHGAGALPSLLGRLDKGWEVTGGFSGKLQLRPSQSASRFFLDSNVYDAAQLGHLAASFAPGRVFLGTDYPYRIMETDVAGLLDAAGLDAPARQSVESRAICDFLEEHDFA